MKKTLSFALLLALLCGAWGAYAEETGYLAPALLEACVLVSKKRHSMVVFAIAALALTGAILMRYCIVAVGMHPEVWTVL